MKKVALFLAAFMLLALFCSCDPSSQGQDASGQTTTGQATTTTAPTAGYAYEMPVPQVVGDWAKKSYFSDAAFIGDSVTTGLQLYSFFENATVLAERGIDPVNIETKKIVSADKTVMEALGEKKFGKIYVMLGANAAVYTTPEDFVASYGKMLDQIKTLQPDAIIYIQSIFPVTKALSEQNAKNGNGLTNERLLDYNQQLQQLAAEKKVYLVNTYEALAGADGYLPANYSDDGVHIRAAQYQLWYDYLRQHVVTK